MKERMNLNDNCYRDIPEILGAVGSVVLDTADLEEMLSMSETGRIFYTEGVVSSDNCFPVVDRVSSYINNINSINGDYSQKISGMILNIVGNIGFENLVKIKEMISHNFPSITLKVSLSDSSKEDECRYQVVAV